MKRRSFVARDLRTTKYRKRVTEDKTRYNRKRLEKLQVKDYYDD